MSVQVTIAMSDDVRRFVETSVLRLSIAAGSTISKQRALHDALVSVTQVQLKRHLAAATMATATERGSYQKMSRYNVVLDDDGYTKLDKLRQKFGATPTVIFVAALMASVEQL